VSDAGERLAEKGKSWLGAIQSVGPAAKRGRIGHAIRVFECRRGFFPGIALHKAPSQSLTARQQTVVGVWQRKQWKKGEGLPATSAATPTDPNPVVMRIVGLLSATSMPDDQIASTSRASPHDVVGAALGPLCFELVCRDAKWDKQNRSSWSSALPGVDLPRSEPEAELLPPEKKSNWKRIPLLGCRFSGV
jgi:hypothetical protein